MYLPPVNLWDFLAISYAVTGVPEETSVMYAFASYSLNPRDISSFNILSTMVDNIKIIADLSRKKIPCSAFFRI
jgi:hypothetical protein